MQAVVFDVYFRRLGAARVDVQGQVAADVREGLAGHESQTRALLVLCEVLQNPRGAFEDHPAHLAARGAPRNEHAQAVVSNLESCALLAAPAAADLEVDGCITVADGVVVGLYGYAQARAAC